MFGKGRWLDKPSVRHVVVHMKQCRLDRGATIATHWRCCCCVYQNSCQSQLPVNVNGSFYLQLHWLRLCGTWEIWITSLVWLWSDNSRVRKQLSSTMTRLLKVRFQLEKSNWATWIMRLLFGFLRHCKRHSSTITGQLLCACAATPRARLWPRNKNIEDASPRRCAAIIMLSLCVVCHNKHRPFKHAT